MSSRSDIPPRISDVTFTVNRGPPPLFGCGDGAAVALRVRSAAGSIAAVRMRLLEGSVPFEIPVGPIALERGGWAATTWQDALSPAQLPFGARVRFAAVSESGTEGEWFEVEVWDPGSWAFLAWLGSWFWPVTFLFSGGTVIWALRRRELLSKQHSPPER
jgi:hypothetical protein